MNMMKLILMGALAYLLNDTTNKSRLPSSAAIFQLFSRDILDTKPFNLTGQTLNKNKSGIFLQGFLKKIELFHPAMSIRRIHQVESHISVSHST